MRTESIAVCHTNRFRLLNRLPDLKAHTRTIRTTNACDFAPFVAMPGAPSSVLAPTSKALVTTSNALVPSSVLAPSSDCRMHDHFTSTWHT